MPEEEYGYINESLRHLAEPIDSVLPDPANERVHDEKNMAAIRGSISRFGQHQVVTVWAEKNIIVAGNGRWQAMKDLGYTHIAVNRKSMTEVEAAALRIADNRTAELARWDKNALDESTKALEAEGYDLEEIGFTEADLQMMLGSDFEQWEPTADSKDGKGAVYSEKVVVSVSTPELVQVIRDELERIIKSSGWETRAEIV